MFQDRSMIIEAPPTDQFGVLEGAGAHQSQKPRSPAELEENAAAFLSFIPASFLVTSRDRDAY